MSVNKVFVDGEGTVDVSFPANQRPEMCPRAKVLKFAGLYNIAQKILTVGDGDFSFSLSIVEHFHKLGKQMWFTATSHESYDSVVNTYPNGLHNIQRLKQLGAIVLHNVDATSLASTPALNGHVYDVVVWNFPCIRATDGMDGQTSELDINRNLLRDFFGNVHDYVVPQTGEVHVTHKTIEPFSWWDIVGLAGERSMQHMGSVIFDRYSMRKPDCCLGNQLI